MEEIVTMEHKGIVTAEDYKAKGDNYNDLDISYTYYFAEQLRLRLNNVSYMNDPSEGPVFQPISKIDIEEIKEPVT
ncbi:MAG: hypothetical protein K0R54_5943 [Clostridiaceae bacterium]|jgi:hypothetical protein|nr:hypothetical protein [Clostridiaceae bacterium]